MCRAVTIGQVRSPASPLESVYDVKNTSGDVAAKPRDGRAASRGIYGLNGQCRPVSQTSVYDAPVDDSILREF